MKKAFLIAALLSVPALAQSPATSTALPSAPVPASLDLYARNVAGGPPPAPTNPQATNQEALTRPQAEQMALRDNPRISVSKLLTLAQHQMVREARSADFPTANGAITAEKTEDASRISGGSLTASRLLTHAGVGTGVSQLITDFGRTHNLVLTQKLREVPANATALATQEEIVLATDQAFYDAMTAQAVLQVAKQTVATRQTTESQVNQMTQNKLRSTLDLKFCGRKLVAGAAASA